MYRILGAGLLFLGCSAAGFSASALLKRQHRLLCAFTSSLALLRGEIAHGARSLPEIFTEAAESAPAPLSGFFYDLASSVRDAPGEPLPAHVSALLSASYELPPPIREAFALLGASLGSTDTAAQLHAIALCEERIRAAEQAAGSSCREQCRTYATAGVCLGAALAILCL